MTEQSLPHLQFINPVGFEGFGDLHDKPRSRSDEFYATVRKGNKWFHRLDQDDLFEVWGCTRSHYGLCKPDKGCDYIGVGQVEYIWAGPLHRIPAFVLAHEHNEDCKDWYGIKQRLHEIYGTDSNPVRKDTLVTGIVFSDIKTHG